MIASAVSNQIFQINATEEKTNIYTPMLSVPAVVGLVSD